MEEVEQHSALALGAPRILLRQHHIHEATGASHQHHRVLLMALQVAELILLVVRLRRDA